MKKLLLYAILFLVISPVFAEQIQTSTETNNRSFFYYTYNRHFKSNLSAGVTLKNYKLADENVEYQQPQVSIDFDFEYYPATEINFVFIGGGDLKIPIYSKRIQGNDKQIVKNFQNGIYVFLSPYLVVGYTFKTSDDKFAFTLAAGFKYDRTKIQSFSNDNQTLKTFGYIVAGNAKIRIKQRYSLYSSLRYESGLNHRINSETAKVESSGVTVQFGLSYDY